MKDSREGKDRIHTTPPHTPGQAEGEFSGAELRQGEEMLGSQALAPCLMEGAPWGPGPGTCMEQWGWREQEVMC